MNSFSNNLEKNEINFEYSNSLIHILYSPDKELNKRSYFKSHNDVIISYKDDIINKNIYVASSSLKRNSVFTSVDFDKILAKKQLSTFVSYFKIFEDKFFRFDLYPQRYKKISEVNFLKKQGLIQKINKRSLTISKFVPKSKYFNKHIILNQKYTYNTYNGTLDKKIIVKLGYREIFLLTSRGVLTPALEPRNYNALSLMTGLFFIFKGVMRKMITKIFLAPYLILRFYIKTFKNKKKNINLFINILIYQKYAKFNFLSFFRKKKKMKIRWKKSNKFIWRFFWRIQRKIIRYLDLFRKISRQTYVLQFFRPSYVNNLLLIKNANFYQINNKFDSISVKNDILPEEKVIEVINYLLTTIPLNLINITNFLTHPGKNIHLYFLYKTLILKEYLIANFNNLNFFKYKKVTSYIDDLFLGKILIKLNTYPNDSRCLVSRRLYWKEVIVPPLNEVIIRTRVTTLFRKKVKKKLINKFKFRKFIYSTSIKEYVQSTFLKFYKIYNLASIARNTKSGIIFKDLNKLICTKVQKFKKRYKLRKKIIKKLFYKLLRRKKKNWRWRRKFRRYYKRPTFLKFKKRFKKILKNRRRFIFKYPKKRKNRIFNLKSLLIKKLIKLKFKRLNRKPIITRARSVPKLNKPKTVLKFNNFKRFFKVKKYYY